MLNKINNLNYEQYLNAKAEEYGFHPSKKKTWIEYMSSDIKRGKALLEKIIPVLNMSKCNRALDIGSGFGGLCRALEEYCDDVYGIEIIKERVEWSKIRAKKSNFMNADACKLPYEDNYFDLVLSTDAFEHMNKDKQVLAANEIYRVLKNGGRAYIEVPNKFQLIDEHNKVLFGTYLPPLLRKIYTKRVSKNKSYVQCWERSGKGWRSIIQHARGSMGQSISDQRLQNAGRENRIDGP